MKTVLVYSLAVFYFLISVRVTANVHYCGGKIKRISLIGFGAGKSCCAGKPMKKGCCHDVRFCLKKGSLDHQSSSAVLFAPAVLPAEAFRGIVVEQNCEIHVPKIIHPSVNAPPPELKIPTYLKNCVFII